MQSTSPEDAKKKRTPKKRVTAPRSLKKAKKDDEVDEEDGSEAK